AGRQPSTECFPMSSSLTPRYGYHVLRPSASVLPTHRDVVRQARETLAHMSDEWRVEVDLHDEEHGFTLGERLRSLDLDDEARKRLCDRVIVTRDGPRVFLYAGSEQQAREAERVARELVAEEGLSATIALTRWHP